MMREQYTIFTHPKISKIYLVWDDDDDGGQHYSLGSKCVFVFIEGLQYKLPLGFACWRDLLTNLSYTRSSGIYTLLSIHNSNSISYWNHYAVFDSIESLIEDLKVRTLLEAL